MATVYIHGRRSPKSIKRGRGGQDSFLSLHRITWAVHPSLTVASDIRDYGPPQQPPGIIDPRRDTSRGYINRVLPLSIFRFRTVCLSGDNESTPHPCVDSSQPVEICDASLLPSHPRVRSDGILARNHWLFHWLTYFHHVTRRLETLDYNTELEKILVRLRCREDVMNVFFPR